MRSFCLIVISTLLMTASVNSWAQTDEKNKGTDDLFGPKGESSESTETPDKKPAASSTEMVMDEENAGPLSGSDGKTDADFLSLGGTTAWLERNGFGAHLGLGGYTCSRVYCDTLLDVSILGSIAGTFGAYYRLNPNWSLFSDITISRLNTNYRSVRTDTGDNHGVAFQLILGPAFHLPVKGWLDLYTTLGIGPIALRAKVESNGGNFSHHWGGLDIEWGLGADFYFWSVGPLKNFSVGPYMKLGFPIWMKVCEVTDVENCGKPSEMDNQDSNYWDETPFVFQLGVEARLEFTVGGKDDTPKIAPMEDDTTAPKAKEDSKKPSDEDTVDTAKQNDDDDDGDDAADKEEKKNDDKSKKEDSNVKAKGSAAITL